ncbi:enterobactin exporter EntS [Oceanobacillus picturae]|uniref:Enterobactin exporter EntS n=2 Tax=Oceanobacillus picturae TaxID=171693 RepID=W9AB80_9BACI|nr:MFS transporter [Oceanobacillus picturae]CDO02728.1 enterobactin exporter EntS [Oceanobacillus picturae]
MDVSVRTQDALHVPLMKNRNFILLFLSAFLSSPGYYVYLIGAEWLMLSLSENRFYFGMLFLAASIPRLLLLSFGGVVADRVNKRLILFISDLSRAVLILILILILITDSVTAWHLITLAALFGISDAFSYPVINSLTPMVLEKNQLQRGNSLIQMTAQISPIAGPALGGTLIAVLGFTGVFTVAMCMLFIASIIVLFIRLKKEDTEERTIQTPWVDLKEGLVYAKKNQLIVSIVSVSFFLNFFFTGPFTIGIPIIVKDIFHGSAVSLATVQMSMGIGALMGAVFLAVVSFKKPGIAVIRGLIGLGIIYTFIGTSTILGMTAALVFVMAFAMQIVNIPIMTMLQQTTEKRMLGRIMSLLMTVSSGLVPVSYAVTSLLIAVGVQIQVIIIVSGLVITGIALNTIRNKRLKEFVVES